MGPQQSKKQRKQNAQNGVNKDKRVNRKVALDGIREQFNPFEFKQAGGRAPKFEVTSMEGKKGKGVLRPGLQKSREQEMVGFPRRYSYRRYCWNMACYGSYHEQLGHVQSSGCSVLVLVLGSSFH